MAKPIFYKIYKNMMKLYSTMTKSLAIDPTNINALNGKAIYFTKLQKYDELYSTMTKP